jgi:putative Mn2+ efflux pump MntP
VVPVIIGIVTFVLSPIGFSFGNAAGKLLRNRIKIVGGRGNSVIPL